jgi:hypothetical protein
VRTGRQQQAQGQAVKATGFLPQLLQFERTQHLQYTLGPWLPYTLSLTTDGHSREDNKDREEEDGETGPEFSSLLGDAGLNVVGRTDPVINIRIEQVRFMLSWKY